MKSKTYYGEYSLMHWVNMMLTNNITLPEYQRSFVWGEKDIKRLLKSIAEGQFVQPVTIALYPDYTSKKKTNLILDGQQRLTSILLAYIGYNQTCQSSRKMMCWLLAMIAQMRTMKFLQKL